MPPTSSSPNSTLTFPSAFPSTEPSTVSTAPYSTASSMSLPSSMSAISSSLSLTLIFPSAFPPTEPMRPTVNTAPYYTASSMSLPLSMSATMLLWNRNEHLCNGTTGTFLGQHGTNHILVDFEGVGQIRLKRELWQKRGRSGEVVGSRTQYPVALSYATTCHKSKGLTLPAAVVHCTKEFVPGLIYVSVTRVQKSEHLQVLNFCSIQLLSPSQECNYVCKGHRRLIMQMVSPAVRTTCYLMKNW